MSIEKNAEEILKELKTGNPFGEKITLVAATKTRTAEEINRVIAAGVPDVGENRVQEFLEKFDAVRGGVRHFIGHLQTNKVKYLVGKIDLYHSVDRDELALELSKRSARAGIVSDVLLQINIGCEESKGGYPLEEGLNALARTKESDGLRVRGFMAMLPLAGDGEYKKSLCKKMRALFDEARERSEHIDYLSMGMSGDWKLCVSEGANMIRVGTALFGTRVYGKQG